MERLIREPRIAIGSGMARCKHMILKMSACEDFVVFVQKNIVANAVLFSSRQPANMAAYKEDVISRAAMIHCHVRSGRVYFISQDR